MKINGHLEIDVARGVVYFHADHIKIAKQFRSVTVLRICSLPKPIPLDRQLDVTHMCGASWGDSVVVETQRYDLVADVNACQRCGGHHERLEFSKLSNPVDDYAYWATCPQTNQPVLLALYNGEADRGEAR